MNAIYPICATVLVLSSVAVGSSSAVAHQDDGASTSERVELSFGRSADFDYDPPEPGSYRLPAIKTAADGTVIDSTGQALRLIDAFAGRITVLSFIYTRCVDPRGCPAAMRLLEDIRYATESDPGLTESVGLISLSFDPNHDTPSVMAEFADAHDATAKWRFLTTTSASALAPILKAYGQPVGAKPDPDDPYNRYSHQIRVYLIDRNGMIRNIYSLGFLDPRLVITDIRTLIGEERAAARR